MAVRLSALLCCLVLTLFASPGKAQVAYLKTAKIFEGDVALLVVEFKNDTPSLFSLDTSPLNESFDVLAVKSFVRKEPELNKVVYIMHWEVELSPKNTGRLNIPALNIRGTLTPELTLEVTNKTAVQNTGEKVFIEAKTVPTDPLPGQLTVVTVKMIYNRQLLSGHLLEPKFELAKMYRLAADKRYEQIIDGETFIILEREIGIVFDAPGTMIYAPFEFRGEIENRGPAQGIVDRPSSRRIRRLSPPIKFNVQPWPPFSGRHWLPAAQLEVTQKWDYRAKDLRSGDSITRTLSITAKGLPAAELPSDLFQARNKNMVSYPDEEQRKDSFVDGGLVGQLVQAHVIVLSGQGEIKIPDIGISWWDVDEMRAKELVLAGRTLNVLPAISPGPMARQTAMAKSDNSAGASTLLGQWLGAGLQATHLMIILVLVVSIWLFLHYFRSISSRQMDGRFDYRRLKRACHAGDAKTARSLVIAWARERWPAYPIHGLNCVKTKFDSLEFRHELAQLDASLYARNRYPWQGRQLWQSFIKLDKAQHQGVAREENTLPDLYPKTG